MNILKELSYCHSCPIRQEARVPIGSSGPFAKGTPMVVGRSPTKLEDEVGEPFLGREGSFVNRFLFDVGLEKREVYFTNVIKCHTLNGRSPEDVEIMTCSQKWLHDEGALIEPSIVFVLGPDAYLGMFGHRPEDWEKKEGTAQELGGVWFVFFPNVEDSLHNRENFEKWIEIKHQVKLIVRGLKEQGKINETPIFD